MLMKSKKKNKKKKFKDTSVTIADMNVEGMPRYKSPKEITHQEEMKKIGVTKKEKCAMIFGAFLAYLPLILIIIGSYVAVFLLIYFLFLKK